MNEDGEASSLPPWYSWQFMCCDNSIFNSTQATTTCATGATPYHVANAETTPSVDLVTKEEPTPTEGPIFKEEPTPEEEETTKADDKVSRFEIAFTFYTRDSPIASLKHSMRNSL